MISFVADESSAAGRVWVGNVRRALGDREVVSVGPPGSESRRRMWERAEVDRLGVIEARSNPGGAVICHVGAGSREKMWGMGRWAELVLALGESEEKATSRMPVPRVQVIAGEVEAERFSREERQAFERLGGEFIDRLDVLADRIER